MIEANLSSMHQRTDACAGLSGERWVDVAQDRIRSAITSRTVLNLEGAGTRGDFGGPLRGEPLSAAGYRGIVEYDPGDLVVTVRAGTPLDELDAELARHGQMLGFEPPRRAGSTIGGAVALGWSGPRRPFAGALRDHLIGARLLDGRARVLRFGGKVVKNVAGFDVARLMGGSLGILGLLLDVSLRVVPRPMVERTTVVVTAPEAALQTMQRLAVGPGLLSAASYVDGQLYLRSSGSDDCVAEFLARHVGTELSPSDAQVFWQAFNNQTLAFFQATAGLRLWRVSVNSDAPHAWPQFPTAIDWAGALRWVMAPPAAGAEIAAWARVHGGHASLWAHATGAERAQGVFTELSPPLRRIHRELSDIFDPHRVFNRARMYPSLEKAA
ncbi:glycolate oxidase subunit GlcE [Ramlibacter sp. 2FC]|uniref:glycolate oxidase subunit GlcE n=1 Tax=Ramlibacter sp. 2FC TaxID=2502188 RepID=UPI0010F626A4|nr:glycolate oxidase subunit GlcE [Ramlibacter sp. 2FC]